MSLFCRSDVSGSYEGISDDLKRVGGMSSKRTFLCNSLKMITEELNKVNASIADTEQDLRFLKMKRDDLAQELEVINNTHASNTEVKETANDQEGTESDK